MTVFFPCRAEETEELTNQGAALSSSQDEGETHDTSDGHEYRKQSSVNVASELFTPAGMS